jgi:hypothetical protein
MFAAQAGPSPSKPSVYGLCRGNPVRDDALLSSLPQDPHGPPFGVEIVHVQAAKFTHSDPRRVKQLQHG